MRYRLCVVLGMLSLASPVGAQDLRQQWAWCLNKDNAFTADQSMAAARPSSRPSGRCRPTMAIAFRSRGNAYADKGQPDRAIEDYDQALRLNPNYAAAYHNRGSVYLDRAQYDRAIQDFDQAIRLNPNDVLALINRGIAWRRKGQYDRAIQDYDQAIAA